MKLIIYFYLIATLLSTQSCTQNDLYISTDPIEQKLRLREATEFTHINAYVFLAGVLVNIIEDLPVTESTITIKAPVNAQIYFLAGLSTLPASLTSLDVNRTSIETFLSLRSDLLTEAQAGSATLFFTGYHPGSGNADASVHEIPMTRSIARLNLDTSSDPLIKIDRIVANNVLLSGLLFGNQANAANNIPTGTAEKSFDTPVSGIYEACMYLFESSSPISFTLHGRYNEEPIVVNLTIPLVKRNSIYTIKVSNEGTIFNGAISTAPWEQGDVIESTPDLGQSVSIDMERTIASEGMTIDKEANHILISERGGRLTLSLTAETALEIASIEGGNPLITIDNPTVTTADNKSVITLPIVVTQQERGRLPYRVKINLRSPLTQNPYDVITLDVEGSSNQIPTVSFAGLTLMAFNTTGPDLENQVYILDGSSSILEIYTEHWPDCTGKMFQFGRSPGYYPNQSMTPQPTPSFLNWNEANGAPCPEGFRMPTSAEMRRIFPPSRSGVSMSKPVPISYTIDGKAAQFDIIVPNKLVALGNVRNITPRYVRLVCEQDTLIFPMAGYGWASTTATNIGESFYIMASNRDTYTKVYGYYSPVWKNEHSDLQQRGVNNFNFIRCVKK